MNIQNEGEIFDEILNRMMERIPDTQDKRESSAAYVLLAPVAQELAFEYAREETNYNEAFVDTASLESMIRKASERGIEYRKASPSFITAKFKPNNINLLNERMFAGEVAFLVVEKINEGEYLLVCEQSGVIGNISSGYLIPANIIPGLQTAEITGIRTYGADSETLEALRNRYYDDLLASPFGGNIADYRETVMSVPGVGGVRVIRAHNGGGTVKVVVLDNDYTCPSPELVAQIQELLDPNMNGDGTGLAPIDHIVTVCPVNTLTVNIDAFIEYESGYTWENLKDKIFEYLLSYFAEVCKQWSEKGTGIVRIGKIETTLSSIEGVVEVRDTTLNSSTSNITFTGDSIPLLGKVNGHEK